MIELSTKETNMTNVVFKEDESKQLDDLSFTTRVKNAFKAENIYLLKDLLNLIENNEYPFRDWHNFGSKSVDDIKEELVKMGYPGSANCIKYKVNSNNVVYKKKVTKKKELEFGDESVYEQKNTISIRVTADQNEYLRLSALKQDLSLSAFCNMVIDLFKKYHDDKITENNDNIKEKVLSVVNVAIAKELAKSDIPAKENDKLKKLIQYLNLVMEV